MNCDFDQISQVTRTGPLGPALRTVAPNHCSDFWSICWPDALLLPVDESNVSYGWAISCLRRDE